MKTAFDTIDWKQAEEADTFFSLNIDAVAEWLVSGQLEPLDLTEPMTISLPPSSCFFHYDDLDPDKPVQIGIYCRSLRYYDHNLNIAPRIDGSVFDVLQMDVMVANEYVSAYTYSAYAKVYTEEGIISAPATRGMPFHPLPTHIATALTHTESPVYEALVKCPGLSNTILEPYQSAVRTAIQVLSASVTKTQLSAARNRRRMRNYKQKKLAANSERLSVQVM